MTCFAWRDKGECAKHAAGDCEYAHPKALKGTGHRKGGKGGKGKHGDTSKGNSSGHGGKKGGKGDGGRSPSPKRTIVTKASKL